MYILIAVAICVILATAYAIIRKKFWIDVP